MNTNYKSIVLATSLFFALATSISAAPGDLDLTFSGDGKLIDGVLLPHSENAANGVAVQADGKIVVAGVRSLARYNPDGSLDTTFGSGGYIATCNAADVAIQVDGKIVVGCSVNFPTADFAIVRYNPDGSLDTSFGIGGGVTTSFSAGRDELKSIAIQSDGKIVAAGSTDSIGAEKWWNDLFAVARYNADGSLDTTFDGDGKVTRLIGPYHRPSYLGNGVAVQSDGKIIVVGSVNLGGANGHQVYGMGRVLLRYNVNGSLDTSFNSDGIATTPCAVLYCGDNTSSVAIQVDGKIVTAGARGGFNLARYNIDGSPDNTFGDGGSVVTPIGTTSTHAEAHSVAIRSDGKIVAAGKSYASTTGPIDTDLAVVRYNSNGSLDTTFDVDGIATTPVNQGPSQINSVALQPDGMLIAVGFSSPSFQGGSSSEDDFIVARYNDNGSLDTAFDSDGIVITDFSYLAGSLSDVAIQTDGKIVAVGGGPYYAGPSGMVRYDPDGSRDTTFGGGTGMANVGGSAVALQTDGKILTAGYDSCGDINETYGTLARVNQNGSLDTSFDGDGFVELGSGSCDSWFSSLAIQPDGKIVAAGSVVARYNSDGTLDTTFGGGDGLVSTFNVVDIAIGSDGKIAIAGSNYNGSDSDFLTGRLNSDGSFDTTFDGDGTTTTPFGPGNDQAISIVFQADGKIVAAGYRSVGSNEDFAVVRYDLNGSLDPTFDSDGIVTTPLGPGDDTASSVAIDGSGKLVVAGTSSGDFALMRYLSNGSLDTTFGGGDGISTVDFGISNDQANGMALDGQGRAVVVGTSDGRFAIARFLGDPIPTSTCPNPIDCPDFFVRQHYKDFLNREPDPAGLAFWTNEINACGFDPQCVEVKRINVSAAYFLSIEFQQSGYLVYRFYKSAFGNLPGAPVPVRLSDFLPDAQAIGQGVIVNQGNWQQQLETNKQNYANAFVQRATFTSFYNTSMSPGTFVDSLFANAGVNPTSSERAAAVAEFNSAANTADTNARARALRLIAENSTLQQQEFNRAFVLMQYFSYLRRNPNDAPDVNFDGYNFWLNKLNQFNGNYVEAEMVKAFLWSSEYRHRFGS